MATDPNLRKLPASRGWHWLIEGFSLLRRAPLIWIAFTLFLFLGVELAARLPVLGVLLLLFYPLALAGLMLACADLEQGRAIEFARVFAVLRENPSRLTTIGGVYLVGQLLIMWVMVLIGGDQMHLVANGQIDKTNAQALAAALGTIMRALLAGLLLSLPLLMAVWFSPLLVVFEKLPSLKAMRLSMQACWMNRTPFLVYGLLALGIVILVMLPFGTANPQSNPGLWFATPLLLPSIYTSYRDVYGTRERPALQTPATDNS